MALLRIRWLLLASLIIFVGSAWFWRQHVGARTTVGAQPKYTTTTVMRGPVVQTVLTTGQLSPLVAVEISTQISGQLTDVNVDFNTTVTKGQVLAKIDPATYEQKLKQAEADLASTEASVRLLRQSLVRNKELFSRGMVSQSEYDQSESQLQQAESGLLTRKAALASARLDLERCTLISPIDGVVIFKSADVGKTVQASFSAPTLFVIAQDLRKMQIIAPISETDILSVKPGLGVSFTVDPLPDRKFYGKIKQVRNPYTPPDQQASRGTAGNGGITTFDAVIEVDNPDQVLLPSLTATVSIIVAERLAVLRVPNGALRLNLAGAAGVLPMAGPATIVGNNTATVHRLTNGQRDAPPEQVTVRLGLADSLMTEVVEGLQEGDTLVTGVRPVLTVPGARRLF